MEGQGEVIVKYPEEQGRPSSLTIRGSIPGKGSVALPGLSSVIPGRGAIMMLPVSVCHQVSKTGHLFCPIRLEYQFHASGLIGSPTTPSSLSDERSRSFSHSSPHFMKVL